MKIILTGAYFRETYMFSTDTIAAISTSLSPAGISVVRVSGPDAFNVAATIVRRQNGESFLSKQNMMSHTIRHGYVFDGDILVDEVLLMIMKAPNTYTGEDSIEINCHGGIIVTKNVLNACLHAGARLADPGEFSKRSFLNGKMDLSQAEAVIDLINSKNQYAADNNIKLVTGNIGKKLKKVREGILHEVAFIETALDDPEHISLEGYDHECLNKVNEYLEEIKDILRSSRNGRLLSEGISTAIVGRPNVGKSSLLNALVGEDRAIVTDIAGTTRDVLRESVNIDGITLDLLDTAGIHETDDTVERIGVDRSLSSVENADLVLWLLDSTEDISEEDRKIADFLADKKKIAILNKIDISNERILTKEIVNNLTDAEIIEISAKEEIGLKELSDLIKDMFFSGNLDFTRDVYLTNERQISCLEMAQESLIKVTNSIMSGMPEDFYTIDMMDAYEALGRITGESMRDDLANEIFSKFCMGK